MASTRDYLDLSTVELDFSDILCLFRSSHKSQAEAISKALGHSTVAVADPRSTSPESIGASGLGWRLFHLPSVTGNLCLSSSGNAQVMET